MEIQNQDQDDQMEIQTQDQDEMDVDIYNQIPVQTPNTSQVIISTPLSNSMKKIIGRTSKLLGDGSIKIETNKKNINNNTGENNNDEVVESVLTESEVCQLVDSFEEHINKLKKLLVESEVYRQQREFIIRNEMMKQIETQMGQLQEYQSIDTIKENNKVIVENLINVQDLSQLQRDNDKLISKLKRKDMIINSLGQEIETLENQITEFKEQKKTIEDDKQKISEKLKKIELITKTHKKEIVETNKVKKLEDNISVMETVVQNKQESIDKLKNDIIQIQQAHEESYEKFKKDLTKKFNEKKRKYEDTINDLNNQIYMLKTGKKMKPFDKNNLKRVRSEVNEKEMNSDSDKSKDVGFGVNTSNSSINNSNNVEVIDLEMESNNEISDVNNNSLEKNSGTDTSNIDTQNSSNSIGKIGSQKPTKVKRKRKLKKGKDAIFLDTLKSLELN